MKTILAAYLHQSFLVIILVFLFFDYFCSQGVESGWAIFVPVERAGCVFVKQNTSKSIAHWDPVRGSDKN